MPTYNRARESFLLSVVVPLPSDRTEPQTTHTEVQLLHLTARYYLYAKSARRFS